MLTFKPANTLFFFSFYIFKAAVAQRTSFSFEKKIFHSESVFLVKSFYIVFPINIIKSFAVYVYQNFSPKHRTSVFRLNFYVKHFLVGN